MNASLQIDDDVYEEAQRLAASENRSLGEVLSDLVRKALRAEILKRKEGGFPRFSVPQDTPPITLELVKTAEFDS
jgi:hypothetical protein